MEKLNLYKNNQEVGCINDIALPHILQTSKSQTQMPKEYRVEKIIASRNNKGRQEYQIKW